MEEKKKKKEDDLLAKESRKREKEEKKQLREAATKKKAEEKAIKAAAVATKKLQAIEKLKGKGKGKKSVRQSVRNTTTGEPSTSTACDDGSQLPDQNVCAVCLGGYEDDIVGGELQAEWLQCTNVSCNLWMHGDCTSKDPEGRNFVCLMCNVTFK